MVKRAATRKRTSASKRPLIVRIALLMMSFASAAVTLLHPAKLSDMRADDQKVCAVCVPKCEGKTYCDTRTGKCEAQAVAASELDMRSGAPSSAEDQLKLDSSAR